LGANHLARRRKLRKNAKTLVDTLAWAASTDKQIDLPNEGLITRIDLEAQITADAAAVAAHSTDAFSRIIQNIKIEGGGGKAYVGMSGDQMGRLLHFMNVNDFGGRPFMHPFDQEGTYITSALFRLHFGSRPVDAYGRDNPFDLTAFIPAQDETNLKLTWTTTALADIIDDTVNISAITIYAHVYQVVGLPSSQGMIPVSATTTYAHTANYSDLGKEFDVPTGAYLRRIVMLVQDETTNANAGPLRAYDEVPKVGLLLPKESRRLIELRTQALSLTNYAIALQQKDASVSQGALVAPFGFFVIDLRPYTHPDFGANLIGFQTGDVKLGITIENLTGGDDTIIWWDEVQPYAGKTRNI
jgi:hypothetical protein